MAKTYLHLANGATIEGESIGYDGSASGEIVFTTGMTGYVQSLTDPSFAGQILTFTYPLIGNYGVPKLEMLKDHVVLNFESKRIWTKAIVIGEVCASPSHYQNAMSLSEWLKKEKIPAIAGIDTRLLTHIIREQGCMRAVISPEKKTPKNLLTPDTTHWVARASIKKTIYHQGTGKKAKNIVLIDCGVKHAIIRELLSLGVSVTQIPWDADPLAIKKVDGIVCSNGPADPKQNQKTIENIKKALASSIPYLGICLGHQLLSLAIGADTYKLPYGHRGLNQPCQDITSGKAYVTSQNHGYAVDRKTIPAGFEEWFINLNDHTNEGIRHKTKNIQSVQFHPEGHPGPDDARWIFKKFVDSL